MRHRMKSGKIGSYSPEKIKVNDEALAAMEFYDSPDEME